jgi:predicted outer membrane protein
MLRIRNIPVPRPISGALLAVTVACSATPLLSAQGSMPVPPAKSGRGMSGHASADSAQALVNLLTTVNRDQAARARLALTMVTRADVRAYAERVLADHLNALSAWELKVPALSLTVPDSAKPATRSTPMTAGNSAMTNGVSEVRDTATGARGGVGAAALHSANIATLARLQKLGSANFDSAYVAAEVDGYDTVMKELDKHPTTYTALQTLLTEFKSMVLDHRAAARKLQAGP